MTYFQTKTLALSVDLFIQDKPLYEYADKVRVRAARIAPEVACDEDPGMHKNTWKDKKKLLRLYEDARDDNGFVEVTLRRSANKSYGRVYPKGGLGFCILKRPVRHAIMGGLYTDFDLRNCHVAIFHDTLSRNYPADNWSALKRILDEREELNDFYMKDKAFWPSLLYGKKDDVPGDAFFKKQLLPAISKGVKRIREDNPELYKAACDSKEDPKNPYGTFLYAYLSEVETRVISEIIQHLSVSTDVLEYGDKKPVCAYEYDGFKLLTEAVERYGGEARLLEVLNNHIVDKWGFTNVKLMNKPMESALDLGDYLEQAEEELEREAQKQQKKRKRGDGDTVNDFQAIKIEFEKTNCKIMKPVAYARIIDGEIDLIPRAKLIEAYEHSPGKAFINWWTEQENIRLYKRIDFFPPPLQCPPDVYNTYQGLHVEQTLDECRATYEALSPEEKAVKMEGYNLIMTHIFNQSGCDDNAYVYSKNWIAQMIQRPGEKPQVALVIRSEQGSGKNMLWSYIGNNLLGPRHFYSTEKADNLMGKFAMGLKDRILVVLDEASGKENKAFSEVMKARITEIQQVFESKGKDKVVINDCTSWVILSNKQFVVEIESSDRRYYVIEASNRHNTDPAYFILLADAMKDPIVTMLVYDYFKTLDITGFNPRNRPVTEAYYQAKGQSRSLVSKFIHDYLQRHKFLVKEKVTNSLGQEVEEYTRKELVYANDFFESFQYYLTDIGGDKSKWRRDSFGTAVMAEIGKMEPCVVNGKRSMKQVMKRKRNDRRCYILDTKHIMERFAKQGYVEKEDAEEDMTPCALPIFRDPMLDPEEDQRRW